MFRRFPLLPLLLIPAVSLLLSRGEIFPPEALAQKPATVRPPDPGIYIYEELTGVDAARVDREKTIILQPVGIIHPHGPHLPISTDNMIVEALVLETAKKIREQKPEYSVLVLPNLPLGTGPSNEVGYIYTHPGAISLSRRVLEALLVDGAINFAENSWHNYFFVSFHHDVSQQKIVSEVAEFLHHGYSMRAANLTSLVLADSAFLAHAEALDGAPGDTTGFVFDLHGGAAETSLLLAVAPQHVNEMYRTLKDFPARTWEQMAQVAQRRGWHYYFGAPSKAGAAYGKALLDLLATRHAEIVFSAMADHDFVEDSPRLEEALTREFPLREVVRSSEANEVKVHQKYQAWIRARQQKEGGKLPPTSGSN